jgi:hypothetical protein
LLVEQGLGLAAVLPETSSLGSPLTRLAGLRPADLQVITLIQVLCLFMWLPEGFRNAARRQATAQALGLYPHDNSSGRTTYDLHRLSRHGLIVRIPDSFRYLLTDLGSPVTVPLSKDHARVLRPGAAQLLDRRAQASSSQLRSATAAREGLRSAR